MAASEFDVEFVGNDKTMLRAAMLAIMNRRIGNSGNIENVIKRFVETANENGITYGVDIDGKTYFNIEDFGKLVLLK